ncbi:MAG: leucyl/phenylalanyl-tRNA--protein transferase [Candidatus Hodarchaeales archaeon]
MIVTNLSFIILEEGNVMIPPEILLKAYQKGFFPMGTGKNGTIEWYTSDPRGVLFPEEFVYSKRLERTLKSKKFSTKYNFDFEATIRGCAEVPREGMWISEDIIQSYINLHNLGYAHSVETYFKDEKEIAGGLYGVSVGGIFFGESMFFRVSDASKIALIGLVERLKSQGFLMVDMQMLTEHMKQFGGKLIPQTEYLILLEMALKKECSFD